MFTFVYYTSDRFEKPIKRQKVKNFAANAVTVKMSLKIKELQCTRDLFGRLLYLAVTLDLDLKDILSYPLTLVPMSLAHVDGTMHKTDKSKLLKKLEVRDSSEKPSEVHVSVIDGMFLISSLVNLPST